MVQTTVKSIVSELEREIEKEVHNRPSELRPVSLTLPSLGAPSLAMPEYVEHQHGATEIGKLSAEAVVRE